MERIIILFGKPGAGKGTRLSKFLEGKEEQYEVLSVSSLLRKERKEQTELGKKAEYYMDSGLLVPDQLINEIVIKAIKKAEKTVVIDGFPRTVGQARAMLASGINRTKVEVIELYVDDDIVIQRAKDRIVCEKCGESYTTNEFKKPKKEGVCDKCGGILVRRKDDDEDVVKKRLKVYENETYPVLKVLENSAIRISTLDNHSKEAGLKFEILMS